MSEGTRLIVAAGCTVAWLLLLATVIWRHRRRNPPVAPTGAVLIAYASQTGTAAALAEVTAQALTQAGRNVTVRSLGTISPADLAAAEQALFLVATTGQGDPAGDGLGFLRAWERDPRPLPALRYALLALGDRDYRHYCAFGHRLDLLLREAGATPAADLVEVNRGDAGALRHWQQNLRIFGASTSQPDWEPPLYACWHLAEREWLNAGSPGAAMYRLSLKPVDALPHWQAGDVAEVYPGPATEGMGDRPPLSHRDYTLATVPEEGDIGLVVRLFRDAAGQSGLGSGWLCERAEIGAQIALRIRSNPQFHAPPEAAPLILIGNGTGVSGLRAHLRARPAGSRNWLIYGERDSTCDRPFANELDGWAQARHLERLDRVFSRGEDGPCYVQELVTREADGVRAWVAAGAVLYLCGSVAMGNGVDAALRDVLGADALEALDAQGRYRRDTY